MGRRAKRGRQNGLHPIGPSGWWRLRSWFAGVSSMMTIHIKLFLAATFLLRFAFLGVPEDGRRIVHDFFLLSNLRFTAQEYIYHLFASVWDAAFAYVVMREVTRLKFMPAFFYFFLGRLIEFVLTGNDIWFMWGWFPVSWNTMGAILVFGSLIWYNDDE